MEVVKIIKKILFIGTIQGTVSSFFPHVGYIAGNWAHNNFLSFIIKLDKVIEGNPIKLPEEFPVLGQKYVKKEYLINTHVRNKDVVYVTGKIIQNTLKHWKKDVIWMKAEHIYNETLNFGY